MAKIKTTQKIEELSKELSISFPSSNVKKYNSNMILVREGVSQVRILKKKDGYEVKGMLNQQSPIVIVLVLTCIIFIGVLFLLIFWLVKKDEIKNFETKVLNALNK